jgi:hypothetical protein
MPGSLDINGAKSVPEKTPALSDRANRGHSNPPNTLVDQVQRTMLSPDYQDFANRRLAATRDNTVIWAD